MGTRARKTNYEAHMKEILALCADSPCFSCLARQECTRMCVERGIDPTKENPPCIDAWTEWAGKEAKA